MAVELAPYFISLALVLWAAVGTADAYQTWRRNR